MQTTIKLVGDYGVKLDAAAVAGRDGVTVRVCATRERFDEMLDGEYAECRLTWDEYESGACDLRRVAARLAEKVATAELARLAAK